MNTTKTTLLLFLGSLFFVNVSWSAKLSKKISKADKLVAIGQITVSFPSNLINSEVIVSEIINGHNWISLGKPDSITGGGDAYSPLDDKSYRIKVPILPKGPVDIEIKLLKPSKSDENPILCEYQGSDPESGDGTDYIGSIAGSNFDRKKNTVKGSKDDWAAFEFRSPNSKSYWELEIKVCLKKKDKEISIITANPLKSFQANLCRDYKEPARFSGGRPGTLISQDWISVDTKSDEDSSQPLRQFIHFKTLNGKEFKFNSSTSGIDDIYWIETIDCKNKKLTVGKNSASGRNYEQKIFNLITSGEKKIEHIFNTEEE